LLSAFDLGADKLAACVDFMNQDHPEKMYGYASAFYLLARYLQDTNRRPNPGLKVIFATAEPLFDFQRKLIEDVFGCRVAVEYGARDAGLMANECPKGGLHIPSEGMILEIDQPDADGLGEIVVTNLYSKAMPIIRYRTGDMGELDPAPCPCGRGSARLKRVEGRRTDFLVTPSGRIIHALAVIYVLREMAAIKQFQVIQEEIDRVLIRVVAEPSFSSEDQKMLVQKAQVALGRDIRISVERTDEISRLPSGKFRYVVSQVADAYLNTLSAESKAQGVRS
jgi:phenylacetate-CoA ligase